jgi:cytochrome c-type biogenesis protein
MFENATVLLAFGAGFLSFFSPCVLPLIPSWLCVIGGVRPAPVSGNSGPDTVSPARGRLVMATLSFVLGFGVVFIALSIVISRAFLLFSGLRGIINIISGLVVITLGLNIIFNFLKFLNYERRFHPAGRFRGLPGSFLAGLAFGAGWTPCVGPVLGSVLLLAGQSGRAGEAALCLALYSAGLGLPFLGAAFLFDRSFTGPLAALLARVRPALPLIQRISGVFLVALGLLMLSGRYQTLSGFLSRGENPLEGKLAGALGLGSVPQNKAAGKDVAAALKAVGLPALPEPVPFVDFSLPLLSGGTVNLSDFKGKALFLNFWATWCPPCRAEMPAMEAIYRRYRERGLEILAVDSGESRGEVAAFMEELGLTFPAMLDGDFRVSTLYDIQAFPTTFIINREGGIVTRIVGALDWNSPLLDDVFEALLTLSDSKGDLYEY